MRLWTLSLALTLMLMGTGVALYRLVTADDGSLWLIIAAVVQLTCTLVVGRIWLENKP